MPMTVCRECGVCALVLLASCGSATEPTAEVDWSPMVGTWSLYLEQQYTSCGYNCSPIPYEFGTLQVTVRVTGLVVGGNCADLTADPVSGVARIYAPMLGSGIVQPTCHQDGLSCWTQFPSRAVSFTDSAPQVRACQRVDGAFDLRARIRVEEYRGRRPRDWWLDPLTGALLSLTGPLAEYRGDYASRFTPAP